MPASANVDSASVPASCEPDAWQPQPPPADWQIAAEPAPSQLSPAGQPFEPEPVIVQPISHTAGSPPHSPLVHACG
jgi:hypothetical protein